MYLLDGNICIDFVDGRSEIVRRRVEAAFRDGLSISSISAAELLLGARGTTNPVAGAQRIEQFIGVVRCQDFDDAAARTYAQIAKHVGVRRKSFDRLIAAHARALGNVLVTSIVKHFTDVPGLKIENWTLPL